MLRQLSLFPLNVVLFPNVKLPLHVFEDRYKTMIQRCLEGDSRFGVVLIKSGQEVGAPANPHTVGTVARIISVKELGQGRMYLTVSGEERFRIHAISDDTPYLEARVDILRNNCLEQVGKDELKSAREILGRYVQVLQGLRGSWTRVPNIPDDLSELSYFIADVLQADNAQKQDLLEEDSDRTRLIEGAEIMRDNAEELKRILASGLTRRNN